MNKSVEQALTGLIPSLNGPLPPELLNVAVSLLAQSRSKASSLKPDEEIARTYACAHLACERLKQRLNLPPIAARPPVPPRTYKKVYNYFDSALAVPIQRPSQPQPQTPSKRARANESATSTPAKRTPAAATAATPSKTTMSPAKRSNGGRTATGEDDDAPAWVMPLIRRLCSALDAPAAPPHVYAGVCSVLKAQSAASSSRTRKRRSGGQTREAVEEAQIPALVVVVLFYAMIRLSGRQTSGSEHQQRRAEAVAVLKESAVCERQTEEEIVGLVENFLIAARENGWLELEWFQNMAEGSGLGISPDQDESEDEDVRPARSALATLKRRRTDETRGQSQPAVLQGGLGTMMQDKIDYLSEAKRMEYLEWKEKIMVRVEQLESEERESSGAMDVSAG